MPHPSLPAPHAAAARGVYRATFQRRGWLSLVGVNAAGHVVLVHEELLAPGVEPAAVVALVEARLSALDPLPSAAGLRLLE
jgi:hypothetical protein